MSLCSIVTGKETGQFRGHVGGVTCQDFSTDGSLLATGGQDGIVRIWDVTALTEVAHLDGHKRPMLAVTFCSHNGMLASADEDGTICVWKLRPARLLFRWQSQHTVLRLSASPDGRYLAAGLADTSVPVWDLTSGKHLRDFHLDRGYAFNVLFSPNSRVLAAAEGGDKFNDSAIMLWDPADGSLVRRITGHASGVSCLAFSPDNKVLVSGAGDSTIRLWEVGSGRSLVPGVGHGAPILWVGPSRGAAGWVTVGADQTLRRWNVVGGQTGVVPLVGSPSRASCMALSADGRTVAGGTQEGSVFLWDAATGRLLHRLKGSRYAAACVAFSPDGKNVISGACDGTVRLWSVADGRTRRLFHRHESVVYAVAFSPDGRLIAALGDAPPTLRLWRADTGEELEHQGGPLLNVSSNQSGTFVFSPDGKTLAIAGQRALVLWETCVGKERLVVGQPKLVTRLAFGAKGRTLVTGAADGSTRLWDAASGGVLAEFVSEVGNIQALSLGACEEQLVSAGSDTAALVWNLSGRSSFLAGAGKRARADLESAFEDLASADARKAYQAVIVLAKATDEAVALAATSLSSMTDVDRKTIDALIAELDNGSYQRRESAFRALAAVGVDAKPALEHAISGSPSKEARQRILRLLERLSVPSGKELRWLRTVEVLERIGTLQARDLLTKMGENGRLPRVAEEARRALHRLRDAVNP